MVCLVSSVIQKLCLFNLAHRKTTPAGFQESTSSRSGALQNTRPPLFVVEVAYAEGIEELAISSKNAYADPSDLVVFYPSETEFHTRLEVCSTLSTCERRIVQSFPSLLLIGVYCRARRKYGFLPHIIDKV